MNPEIHSHPGLSAHQTSVYPIVQRLTARCLAWIALLHTWAAVPRSAAYALEIQGVNVVPHVQSPEMQYRKKADFSLGALVAVFVQNTGQESVQIPPSTEIRLRGRTPEEWLQRDDWAWHDFPSAWTNHPLRLPPGAMTVWSWNGKRAPWGTNTIADLVLPGLTGSQRLTVPIAHPTAWISAVTFLGSTPRPEPDSLVFHVANRTGGPLTLQAIRLWIPEDRTSWRTLHPQSWISNRLERFPADGIILDQDRGGARLRTGPLPLTYAAIEVRLVQSSGKTVTVWAHQRIQREVFDISGGWVHDTSGGGTKPLESEVFLKTLRRMHIDTAHIQEVPGYTDQNGPDGLYARYPLKYFNKLAPISHYDSDAVLSRVHAVEFLGEPQYGGGRPVPPQDCWKALSVYAPTRLPTSITHSEERVWRFYAGLSDRPHYDAYRVTAPSPDAWGQYDRWNGQRIRWGAPLETIGEMSRSLRELNRPRPTAYWSQGPHHDWNGHGGRKRGSPTPDELRSQAYHALASRITSLYWFNLSLRSLVSFPDLIEPMTRVGREIRMLDDYWLEGDATNHERATRDGRPDWDLDVVAGPRGALLFALDLSYEPDPIEHVFRFGPPRPAVFRFPLPSYLGKPLEVFRVDADGVSAVEHASVDGIVTIRDRVGRVAVYVASATSGERARIEARRQALVAAEEAHGFNPAANTADFAALGSLLGKTSR